MDKTISMKFFIVLICITAFFFNSIGNGYVMLVLCLIPVSLKILNLVRRVDFSSSGTLILFITFTYISSTFSVIKDDSNKFIFMMIVFLIIKLVLEDSFGWQKFFSSLLFVIAAISVAFTFLSVVAPDMVLNIAKMLFKGEAIDTYSRLFHNDSYAGLYGQTAINAYAISMFLAFAITALFSEKSAKLNYILLGVGIIALLLTKKRSFLLSNVIAALVLFIQNNKSGEHKTGRIGRLLFLTITAVLVIKYAPATQGLVEKMSLLENSGDLSNGREMSWLGAIEIWKQNIIFGIGINTTEGVFGFSTHNVYLQLLAETGIFGAITYVVFLWTSFRRSRKAYQYVLKEDTSIIEKKTIYGVSIYMQVVFIVYSFFGNPVYGINYMLPYIVFVGVMDSYRKYKWRDIK